MSAGPEDITFDERFCGSCGCGDDIGFGERPVEIGSGLHHDAGQSKPDPLGGHRCLLRPARPDADALQRAHRGMRLGEMGNQRSEEHTSELQSLMRISYAVLCLKKKTQTLT